MTNFDQVRRALASVIVVAVAILVIVGVAFRNEEEEVVEERLNPRPGTGDRALLWTDPVGGEASKLPRGEWYARWAASILESSSGMEYTPLLSPARNKYVYCPVPGNGDYFQKQLLHRIAGDSTAALSAEDETGFSPLLDLQRPSALQTLLDEGVLKFMIHRNPLMRTLAYFLENRDFEQDFASFVDDNFRAKTNLSTDQYCKAFSNQNLRPQICFCGIGHAPTVFQKFQYEELKSLTTSLSAYVRPTLLSEGWGNSGDLSLEQVIWYNRSLNDEVFLNYFSMSSFETLENALAEDIEAFGYQEEIQRMKKLLLAGIDHPPKKHSLTGGTEEETSRSEWFEEWVNSFPGGWEGDPYIGRPIPGDCTTYMYCGIPKNGCSQQKYLMLLLLNDTDRPTHEDPKNDAYLRITDIPRASAIQVAFDPSIPKYVVVRNPILRFLSAFRNKIENYRDRGFDHTFAQNFSGFVWHEFGDKSLDRDTYCSTFADVDQHWRPQVCSCGFLHAPHFFKWYRNEDTGPLVEFLYSHMPSRVLSSGWGSEGNMTLKEYFEETDAHRLAEEDDLFLSHYDRSTFEFLVKVMAPDIEMFEYEEDIERLRRLFG